LCIYLQNIQRSIQLNQQQIKACESAFTEHVFIVLLKGMFLIRGERIPMITHDELTDMMAARLSKGEDLDLIYTNPKNHIVCFIPTYEPGGGDSTKCYFVDGREELVCLPMRTITRELAVQEGLRPNYIMTSDGRRSSYTSPKTYGPHLTFAHIKCRRPVGKDVVYGLFNVAIPYEYIVTEGPEPDTSYIHVGNFAPILVYQSPRHVKHKLNEAMLEHCNYVRKMLARIKLSQNPQVVAELFIAWRDLTR